MFGDGDWKVRETVPDAVKISIVMPLYNTVKFVAAAIESIQAQTIGDWELIVVDDGSTDGSLELVQQMAEGDPRIRVFRNKANRGIVYTRNFGVEKCTSEYVCMMDPDDISLPGRLLTQYNWLDQNEDIDLVSGWAKIIDQDGHVISEPVVREDLQYPDILRKELLKANQVVQSSAAFRKEAFIRVGGYRDTFEIGEDYDLWLRITDEGKACIVNDVLIEYRRSQGSVTIRKPACMFAYTNLIQQCAQARLQCGDDNGVITEFRANLGQIGTLDEELAITLVSAGDLAIIARDLSVLGDIRGRKYAWMSLRRWHGIGLHGTIRNLLILTWLYPAIRRWYFSNYSKSPL